MLASPCAHYHAMPCRPQCANAWLLRSDEPGRFHQNQSPGYTASARLQSSPPNRSDQINPRPSATAARTSSPNQTASSKNTFAPTKPKLDVPLFTAGPAEGNINLEVFVPPSACTAPAAPVAVGCVVAVMRPPRESYEAGREGDLGSRVTRTGKPCWSHRVTTMTCSGPEGVEEAEAGKEGEDKGEGWEFT